MPRSARTVYINGTRWKIRRARLRGKCGDCDYGARVIRLDSRVTGTDLLDTILHELCHARWPDLHEEAVTEFATMAATVLDAEGFRRKEDDDGA